MWSIKGGHPSLRRSAMTFPGRQCVSILSMHRPGSSAAVRSRDQAMTARCSGIFSAEADMARREPSCTASRTQRRGWRVSSRGEPCGTTVASFDAIWPGFRTRGHELPTTSLLFELSTPRTQHYSTSSRRLSQSPAVQSNNNNPPKPDPATTSTSTSTSTALPSSPLSPTSTPTTIIPQPLPPRTKPSESREYIWTVPNILTFSRLAITPLIGYTILTSHPYLALSLFFYAGLTDLVDGHLARRYNQQTVLGTVIDPMADKFLMTTVVVCTTVQGLLPVWLAAVVLGRDAALAASAVYFRYVSLPPPKTFARYWDFGLPSAEVRPTEISKINTLLQLVLVGAAMALPVVPEAAAGAWNLPGVVEAWTWLVAATTAWSGASYVFSRDAVKILRR